MKASYLLAAAIFLLSSCATNLPAFNKDKNCSPRGLEKSSQTTTVSLTGQAGIESFKAAQSCYHQVYSQGYDRNHNVCAVIEVAKSGGISFMDVADYDNSLSSELRNCIIDKLQVIDFSEYKSSTILQSFRLDNNK